MFYCIRELITTRLNCDCGDVWVIIGVELILAASRDKITSKIAVCTLIKRRAQNKLPYFQLPNNPNPLV